MNDDELLTVTVNGTPQQIVNVPTPAAAEVFIDFDTGRMIFGTPPPSTPANNLQIVKNTVKWRDSTLKESLMDGARMMWPKVGKIATDDSITLATLQWDYQLPPQFNDPMVRITSVETREIPASSNYFRPIQGWQRIGNDTLRIPVSQVFSPGTSVEIRYEAPYATLSDVEPSLQMLPLWWAAGTLLGFKETRRQASDIANVTAEAQANPPGGQQNAGTWYIRQFYQALAQISRPRSAQGMQSTYDRL